MKNHVTCSITIANSTFYRNSATTGGGAIVDNGTMMMMMMEAAGVAPTTCTKVPHTLCVAPQGHPC